MWLWSTYGYVFSKVHHTSCVWNQQVPVCNVVHDTEYLMLYIYCECTAILTFTSAPITPRLVNRKYSNGLVLLTVCRNG